MSEHLKSCSELAVLVTPEDFCPFTGELLLAIWRGLAEFTLLECRFCPFCGESLTDEAVKARPRRAERRPDLKGCSLAVRRALGGN